MITALKIQKSNRNRVNVHLDGGYRFALEKNLATNLHVGRELSNDEIETLKRLDVVERLYRRARRLISHRQRAERELRDRFDRDGIPQYVQQAVFEKLKDHGLVDDRAFAEAWIENRQYFRPRSAHALRMELRQKGVASELIDALLADFDEQGAAYTAAIKGARRYRTLDWDAFQMRLGGYLARRGFDHTTVSSVVARVWRETIDCEDESEDEQ